jgi:hypothetical protein
MVGYLFKIFLYRISKKSLILFMHVMIHIFSAHMGKKYLVFSLILVRDL